MTNRSHSSGGVCGFARIGPISVEVKAENGTKWLVKRDSDNQKTDGSDYYSYQKAVINRQTGPEEQAEPGQKTQRAGIQTIPDNLRRELRLDAIRRDSPAREGRERRA